MSTHPQLAAMKARAEAATGGPWIKDYGGTFYHIKSVAEHPQGRTPTVARYDTAVLTIDMEEQERNGEFIAHARTDLPKLVDTLLAVIAELESTHFVGREGEFAEGVMAIINRELSPPTDAQVSQELAAAGINMKPAFKRLHEMIDAHRWKQSVCIGWASESEHWVRWTTQDGLYLWLHPVSNKWIGEPRQIEMPTYPTREAAELAVLHSPLPPDIINRELGKE